jgi:hypothetical protein
MFTVSTRFYGIERLFTQVVSRAVCLLIMVSHGLMVSDLPKNDVLSASVT